MITEFVLTTDFWIKQDLQLWILSFLTFILPFHYKPRDLTDRSFRCYTFQTQNPAPVNIPDPGQVSSLMQDQQTISTYSQLRITG